MKQKKRKKKSQDIYSKTQRNHKDTVFRMIYKNPRELLELYNSVNESDYTDPDLLKINTLENAIYTNVKNDVSFVFDCSLNLYEHQSTINPNMPLRMLEYVADVLQKLILQEDLYGERLILIPTPRFIVFYNGTRDQPERLEYRLSSAFEKPMDRPELELIVTVLNINEGKNRELMSRCRSLRDYAYFVACVRRNLELMERDAAVHKAVDECIQQGVLKEFLQNNKAEVIAMSIYEYDEEAQEEGREEGRKESTLRHIASLMETLGLTRDQAMEALKIPETEREKYSSKP